MEAELELGDDPEVPAAAAQPPEQVRVLRLARVQDLAVGGHDLEAGHVVAGQAELPGKPAHSPAEGQAADTGVETLPAVVASLDGWAARSKAPSSAPLHQGPAPARVDPDSAHQGQVNHQAVARHR